MQDDGARSKAERAKDLIQRHFGPCTELDSPYVGDITYIMTFEGWAYLAAVFDYIEGWYNTRRLHSSLRHLSPAEYEVTIGHNAERQAA